MCGARDLMSVLVVSTIVFNQCAAVPEVDLNTQSLVDQQIFVETSLGDFIDKITILQIKKERIQDKVKLENVCKELEFLLDCYNKSVSQTSDLEALTQQLIQVNKNLWDLEDAVRLQERAKTFSTAFVDIVKSILNNNDQRACIKRTINLLGGSRIIEEKSYNHIKELVTEARRASNTVLQIASLSVATALGDLVDRITILEIKRERIDDQNKKGNIVHELSLLNEILGHHVDNSDRFLELKKALLEANTSMWDIQDSLRAKKSAGNFDEEFIKFARNVYCVNDKRVAVKRAINELFGSQLVEEKMYASY